MKPYPNVILPNIKTYFGGKAASGTYQKIINQIPPHDTRFVGCLGAGGILKRLKPAFLNIAFEPDKKVITDWQNAQYIGDLQLQENFFLFHGKFEDYIQKLVDIFGRVFIYLDPPYPLDSRKSNREIYPFEMTDQQHVNLLEICLTLPVEIMISTYPNAIYEGLIGHWRHFDFQSSTRHSMATERLYMNYPELTELHDYQYLGDNASKREDIKNKFKRFKNRFNQLPACEQAMYREFFSH